ncbi:MAG: hypothetical protein GX374_08075 [Bacilli bacterium]|nr:hypothetical protein [Bacilli bacterium]
MDDKTLNSILKTLEQQNEIITQLVKIVAKTNQKMSDVEVKLASLEKVKSL